MKTLKASALLLLALSWPCSLGAQTVSEDEPERRVFRSAERPDLAVGYALAARFKLATRKSTYRIGETIIVSAAVLNTSDRPVFFWDVPPDFLIYDERGAVMNQSVVFVSWAAVPSMFELIEPNHMEWYSSAFVIGCPEKGDGQLNGPEEEDGERGMFENNRFVTENCLTITRPGTYTIKASQRGNGYVIESPGEPEAKTVVGTVEAEPIKIQVIE